MPASESSAEPWLDVLWERLESDWSSEAAHRALLAQCDSPARLAAVARRYRVASRDGARATVAKAQLDRITGLALGHLHPRAPTKAGGHGWKIAWIVVLLLGIAAMLTQR
jgi:hypothetical protein